MRTSKTQRGQAMSEFIAAMALFVPLVLGVIYIGKYSDIKHQAIQASRYAAMERALDQERERCAHAQAENRLLSDEVSVIEAALRVPSRRAVTRAFESMMMFRTILPSRCAEGFQYLSNLV